MDLKWEVVLGVSGGFGLIILKVCRVELRFFGGEEISRVDSGFGLGLVVRFFDCLVSRIVA